MILVLCEVCGGNTELLEYPSRLNRRQVGQTRLMFNEFGAALIGQPSETALELS